MIRYRWDHTTKQTDNNRPNQPNKSLLVESHMLDARITCIGENWMFCMKPRDITKIH